MIWALKTKEDFKESLERIKKLTNSFKKTCIARALWEKIENARQPDHRYISGRDNEDDDYRESESDEIDQNKETKKCEELECQSFKSSKANWKRKRRNKDVSLQLFTVASAF